MIARIRARLGFGVVTGLTLVPGLAAAQLTLVPMVGIQQYDAANDDGYLAWSLQARYQVSPHFRVGLQGTTAHIGIVADRNWTTPSSDERIWRLSAFAEGALHQPLASTGVPVLKRVDLAFRAQLGVFHSSGVTLSPELDFDDPFNGITDTPTGLAIGAGLGLEYPVSTIVRIMVEADLWRDYAYGGAGFDPALLFGVSFAL